MYRVCYLDQEGKEQWRTLYAESLSHATRIADKRCKKGWVRKIVEPYYQ